MSQNTSNPDVTCTLTEEEAEDRSEFVHSILGKTYKEAEEHTDGYTITFDGAKETFATVTTFVSNESQCCSFAEYTIAISPPYEEIDLTITGPDGTKALFEGFIEQLESTTPEDGEPLSMGRNRISPAEQRTAVRAQYADVAHQSASGDEKTAETSCCGDTERDSEKADEKSRLMGYSNDDLGSVAPGANLGLGCGNPTGIASLTAGDIVVDLGSGAGFDCFLTAQEVGEQGHVIGVDMTPEMIEKARENVKKNKASNVEFRLGEIEHLPVADESVDVIISNCVINLSPDKPQVFEEAFRVLRPGGRLAISDIVATAELPEEVTRDPSSVAACIAGGSSITSLESLLRDVGFEEISIVSNEESRALISEWDAERDLSGYIVSAAIEAKKPES